MDTTIDARTNRGLPTLAGLATLEEAAKLGLCIEACVTRLKWLHYGFLRLHEIFTARITAEPIYELKTGFSHHAYLCAEHVLAIRTRIGEMREPPLGLEEIPHLALQILFDEIRATPTTEELLIGIYEVALPALEASPVRGSGKRPGNVCRRRAAFPVGSSGGASGRFPERIPTCGKGRYKECLDRSPAPWLASALRRQAEKSLDSTGRAALLKRARQVNKAVKVARTFQNDLPPALREAGLIAALQGKIRQARNYLDESLAVAERQGARLEHAQTLLARGHVGQQQGWLEAPQDLATARQSLHSLGGEFVLDHPAP